jgi:hypothetical protein
MPVEMSVPDWQRRKLREWLLLLLRFAITQETSDRNAVLAMADELDAISPERRSNVSRFFLRTSEQVCEAIVWKGGDSDTVLLAHVSRITDRRLRDAFRAAVQLERLTDDGLAATSQAMQSNLSARVLRIYPCNGDG